MKKSHWSDAMAMIELIFAIVVMGIVMMAAPQLISTSQGSTSVILRQESINQAVAHVTMMLSYPWDEADTNTSCIPPVLRVTNGDDELDPMDEDPSRRPGVPEETNSRKFNTCGEERNASLVLGLESNDSDDIDDIDDFNGTTVSLVAVQTQGGTYINETQVSIETTISYGTDSADYSQESFGFNFPSAVTMGTSNIKIVKVDVKAFSNDSELNSTISLKAFSCNIGGFAYRTRTLP